MAKIEPLRPERELTRDERHMVELGLAAEDLIHHKAYIEVATHLTEYLNNEWAQLGGEDAEKLRDLTYKREALTWLLRTIKGLVDAKDQLETEFKYEDDFDG